MRAGVISVPSRQKYLNNLSNLITNQDVPLEVYLDTERKGQWYNYFRMFSQMLKKAGKDEPILLLEDDVITIPNWRKYWEKIHADAQNDLYVFYTKQRHLFKEENLKRGYVTKVQARGFYVTAAIYINQQDLPDRVIDWFDKIGRFTLDKNRQTHLDVVIQEYLISINKPWTITVPTLFQHIGYESTLGHKWVTGSPVYIGDYESI